MKILAGIIIFVVVILCIGFLYVKRIAQGSGEGLVPVGFQQIEVNGLSFSVKVQGKPTDTPVILLHGFPESAVMWAQYMDDLVAQGFYVIAPNQRGYSAGARPKAIEDYKIDKLTADVMGIADKLGLNTFHLVGHDWGAAVGWKVAESYPNRITSYAALSVPHIEAFGRAYREDPDQYESSAYIRFFQKKIMPEFALAKSNYERLRAIWTNHEQSEIESYLELFQQKNTLTGAINWYRANFSVFENGSNVGKVKVPTLLIWGSNDTALKRSGIDMTKQYVDGQYRFVEVDAGHWLIQESYDEVTQEITNHLQLYK